MVLITVDSKESDFEVYFKDPIPITPTHEIGLTSATFWYSWYNISDDFDNNTLKLLHEGNWEKYTIPDGNYDSENLNYWMEDVFGSPPIVFDTNAATNRFIIGCSEPGVEIDLSEGRLHQLLGFEPRIYKDMINIGTRVGNITRDVDRVLIHCNLVGGSYQNNMASDIVYSFAPTVSPGSQIQCEPYQPKYLPIRASDYIYSLRIHITDQQNRPIDFRGETMTLVFDLKK